MIEITSTETASHTLSITRTIGGLNVKNKVVVYVNEKGEREFEVDGRVIHGSELMLIQVANDYLNSLRR